MIEKKASFGVVDEAQTTLNYLDMPDNIGILSSHEVSLSNQIQSDMAFVNKKIDKAKQSISQLQTEGGFNSMGLQSPGRLANSRNSSTNTIKNQAATLLTAGTAEEAKDKELSQGILSPAALAQKKMFLFN